MRTERGKGGGGESWVKTEKETQLKGDGGVTLPKLFSLQALGPTEGEPGVVSHLVQDCLNKVYASNKRFCLLMLLLFGI